MQLLVILGLFLGAAAHAVIPCYIVWRILQAIYNAPATPTLNSVTYKAILVCMGYWTLVMMIAGMSGTAAPIAVSFISAVVVSLCHKLPVKSLKPRPIETDAAPTDTV